MYKKHYFIFKFYNQDIKSRNFGEKQIWFRGKLEQFRVPWQEGCITLHVSQNDIIKSSIEEFKQVPHSKSNLRGEVKINFIQDTKVQDAGGLLREWSTMIIENMIAQKFLLKSDTDEVTYKFCRYQEEEKSGHEEKLNAFQLLGLVFGKAVFEKIPLNCFLDRTIIKQMLGQQVVLQDIIYYDKSLYNSWHFLLKDDSTIGELLLTFTAELNSQTILLVEGGDNIIVTNDNKQDYIEKSIQYFTHDAIKPYIQIFLKFFYNVIPKDYLSIFTPEELEMLIFGLPIISLDDWRNNTHYKGDYHNEEERVIWFWEILEKFTPDELAKFLQFCTGSSRVPVEGFSKLESNRSVISPFCLESSEYDNANPYPKAHTCFNRLDLPKYQTKEQMETYLRATLNTILIGQFGLE